MHLCGSHRTLSSEGFTLIEDGWLSNSLIITFGGCLYFRASLTADRNQCIFEKSERENNGDAAYERAKNLGPVKLSDPRVLISSLVLSLSSWLGPFCSPTVRWILLMISLGAFFSPLTIPSQEIGPGDLKSPGLMGIKWLASKLDKYLKQLLAGFIFFLIFKIPWLGELGHFFVTNAFSITEGPASKLFEELLSAGAAVLAIMIVLRMSQMAANGIILILVWTASLSFLWVTLQYGANKILAVQPVAITGIALILTTTCIDFVNDWLKASIDTLETSGE